MTSPAKLEALCKARAAMRGKEPRGERNGASKLSEDQVRRMRQLHATGERPSILAMRFQIDRSNVWHILTRRTWRHV